MARPVIVTDAGFRDEDWTLGFRAVADGIAERTWAVDLTDEADLEAIAPHLGQLRLIRIAFGSFADGRGFTLARRLRAMGYAGRLRAVGHVLADQYAMARRAGFDEVEIDEGLAARQPEPHWRARADWRAHDYQARLRGAA
ncbi:DUF934 domain-containing protein [Rhodobacterales bacterium HKCCE3408]|nr:DUF934 domain-containing protein [Rhodobacterales bacterium HKCCE3408]